ncbi:hypothetical protein HYU22_01980 [Candidatus Woesearchaeota archaeon]|nr:hypothetical protein [Candidatus Woesearchaeota archaeon]
MFFLTYVEPVNLQQGTETLFFVREQSPAGNRSHVVIHNISHYFFTPPLLHDDVSALTEKLKKSIPENMILEEKRYNARRSFVRIAGSKEDLPLLPALFHPQNEPVNSPSRQLRWIYSPGLLLESPDKIPTPDDILSGRVHRQYAPLEALVNDSAAVIDIEMEGWQKGQEHIFMAVYLSPHQKIIFHDLPFDQQEQEGFLLQQFSSPQDLGEKLTRLLHEDDPLWIYGHNVMKYDQLKIRDCTGAYFPATDGHYPVTKSTQGLGRVLTKGRFTLDTYAYYFNYGNLLANGSLGTLSLQKRPLSHAQQALRVAEARRGNSDAFQELVQYCIGDGLASLELAEGVKESASRIALHFRTSPDRVCTAGKSTTAEDYWQRRHFLIKGTSPRSWRTREKPFSLDQLTNSLLTKGFVPGIIDDVHVLYLTPFIAGTRDMLVRRAAMLRQGIEKTDPWGQYALLRALNADISFLVQEYERIVGDVEGAHFRAPPSEYSEQEKAALYCLFRYQQIRSIDADKSYPADPLSFASRVAAAITRTNAALSQYTPINQGSTLTFVRGNVEVQQLEESGYGCSFGQGKVLSLRPGCVIANPFHETNPARFMYQGYSFEKGRKSNFEKRVVKEMLTQLFAGERVDSIRAYLDGEVSDFSAGRKPDEEYYITGKTRTYYLSELTRVLEQRSEKSNHHIPLAALQRYRKVSRRLGNTLSPSTRKELQAILEQCRRDFSFPYLDELWEKVQHPFPPTLNLMIDELGRLMPVPMAAAPGLSQYAAKVRKHLAEFYAILKPAQRTLGW